MTARPERGALDGDVERLERLFAEALDEMLPNPAALLYSDLPFDYQGKRDLVYALGLLNEGENEAALIAGIAARVHGERPGFDTAHLAREAWYYLRTSIDPTWQTDAGEPSFAAALAYLAAVLRRRLASVPPLRVPTAPAGESAPERRDLLLRLRDEAHARPE